MYWQDYRWFDPNKGSAELDKAKLRCSRNWKELNAYYAAEEAEQQGRRHKARSSPHANSKHTGSRDFIVVDFSHKNVTGSKILTETASVEHHDCIEVREASEKSNNCFAFVSDHRISAIVIKPQITSSASAQQRIYQAHVSDEAEESPDWTTALQGDPDNLRYKGNSSSVKSEISPIKLDESDEHVGVDRHTEGLRNTAETL